MKASEIFLQYADPIYHTVSPDISAVELKHLLLVPETIWNTVNLDKNAHRPKGQLPSLLQQQLKTAPLAFQEELRQHLEMWVDRKDHLFGQHHWPLILEVYENVKKAVIVRVKVIAPNDLTKMASIPADWIKERAAAEVVSLR